nr:hypothetical protein [Tanacetum cinerariifolium]
HGTGAAAAALTARYAGTHALRAAARKVGPHAYRPGGRPRAHSLRAVRRRAGAGRGALAGAAVSAPAYVFARRLRHFARADPAAAFAGLSLCRVWAAHHCHRGRARRPARPRRKRAAGKPHRAVPQRGRPAQ